MKLLLDENLDWRLQRFLRGHEVKSVTHIQWSGIQNGALLRQAEGRFDALITMDTGLPEQQNLADFKIAVIVLRATSNRLADTSPLMPKVLALLPSIKPGTVTVIA